MPATREECIRAVKGSETKIPNYAHLLRIWESQGYAEKTFQRYDRGITLLMLGIYSQDDIFRIQPQCELKEFINVVTAFNEFVKSYVHEVCVKAEEYYESTLEYDSPASHAYEYFKRLLLSGKELGDDTASTLLRAAQHHYAIQHSSLLAPQRILDTIGLLGCKVRRPDLWQTMDHRERTRRQLGRQKRKHQDL